MEYYKAQIVKSSVEHAVIITTIGEVPDDIDSEELTTGDMEGILNGEFKDSHRLIALLAKIIGQWLVAESKRICAKLDEEQGIDRKFDSGNEPYKRMYEELARRCLEMQITIEYNVDNHPLRRVF